MLVCRLNFKSKNILRINNIHRKSQQKQLSTGCQIWGCFFVFGGVCD